MPGKTPEKEGAIAKCVRLLFLAVVVCASATMFMMAAAFFIGMLVAALVVALALFVAYPEEVKGAFRCISGKVDGWIEKAAGFAYAMRDTVAEISAAAKTAAGADTAPESSSGREREQVDNAGQDGSVNSPKY